MFLEVLLFVLIAPYLIGSINSSVVIAKIMKLPDPRTYGSKNAGATNIARENMSAARLVLGCDILKGIIAILLIKLVSDNTFILLLGVLSVLLGHIYPIFHKCKGGKGVSVSLGVMFGMQPLVAIAICLVWGLAYLKTKISSVSSLAGFLSALIYGAFFGIQIWLILLVINVVLILSHRKNIIRIFKGQEDTFK